MKDYKKVADAMMQHGIHLVFTGHQHLQDIAQYRKTTEAKTDSLIDISTGSTVSYPNAWRSITVNRDFTQWNVSTEYIKSIPSYADLQKECYKRTSTNLTYGLAWHVNEGWSTIQTYRTAFSLLGLSNFIPDTPQKMTELLMEFLGASFTEVFMIHNTGNENENPRSQAVAGEFEDGVKKLCLKLLKGQVPEDQLDASAAAAQGLLMQYLKPSLTSMLTDTNQASDAALSSRTNDLNAVLTIPKPAQ